MSTGPSARGCVRAGGTPVRGCVGVVIALGIVILAAGVLITGLDSLTAPWAYPLFGRPTLTGHWVGTFVTPSGIHFALYLELERGEAGSGEFRDYFGGRAHWCDDRGRGLENSPVEGSVPPFSGYTGSVEDVQIHIDMGSSPPIGLLPMNFRGEWYQNTLTLQPDLAFWTGSAFQSSTSNPDQSRPITMSMKKAEVNTYRSACAQK
jgi:hypothetical protein